MEKKMNWLRWPLEHYSISLLIIGILFVLGMYGLYVMPKNELPNATIRQGVVIAVYPGATSEEVEQQLARPLERYLFTYGEVNRDKTTTTSQNGMCIMMVRLNDDVNNKDEVWSKLKHGLNSFKMQLPSGVLAVVVNDDFGNTSALLIAIESDQRSYRELKQYSDELSDRLRRIPSISNVKLYGEQKEQIHKQNGSGVSYHFIGQSSFKTLDIVSAAEDRKRRQEQDRKGSSLQSARRRSGRAAYQHE